LSKQRGDSPKSANTAAKASTETTSTLTTSIENYWMVASSSASSSDWFIDCGCTTHMSGHRSMFITYTEYPPNTKKVKGYNGVTSFASGYGSVRLTCQLPDGKKETIILQEVVHLPGSFNVISQSQIMDKDVKVEPVNHYIKCKLARKPFTPTTSRATEPLQLVHSDICAALETAIGGGQYMLLFIDDATRHTDEYILKYKSEALEYFKEWKALREKESGKQVKRFPTDGGGSYTSKKFAEYLKSEGILKETTTPYTPQSNGVVERANRTIMECVRCMLDNAGLSKKYWAFAVSVAVYHKNRTPTRSVVSKTPYEAWHGSGRKPSLKHLREFGCLAFVHVPKVKRKKLDYRATSGIFFGYSISTKQYFIYDPLAKTLHCSRDVVFREGKRYIAPNAADEAILNEHFYRDVIEEPKPTEKQPTERQTEESLDDESPPKPKKKSRELPALETSLGDAWKPPA